MNADQSARLLPPVPLAAVILAAGKGTRMKSDLHKVLHPIAGRAMIEHLMASVAQLGAERQVVVVGSGREQLEAAVGSRAAIAVQEPQLGTGHAVQQAEGALAGFSGDVLVLYGDVPFVSADTMRAMLDRLAAADAPAVVVLGFEPADALQYGRVIAEGDRIAKMVEFKDASEAERAARLCNSGLMAAKAAVLFGLLARVGNDNAQGEYYLPDVVNIALADGRTCAVVVAADEHEVAGINSRAELAEAEARWQARRRAQVMAEGASLIAPETVWFSWDTVLGRDVTIEPNAVFEPMVRIGNHVHVEANLILPSGSDVPDKSVVTRENMYEFRFVGHRSSSWTGKATLSDRAIEVLRIAPGISRNLSTLIAEMTWRGHNQPPELLLRSGGDDILTDLIELRKRLDELISEIEQQGDADRLLERLQSYFTERISPWFKDRLAEAGQGVNGLASMSVLILPTYLALSKLLDQAEYVSIMGAAIGGMLGAGMIQRKT